MEIIREITPQDNKALAVIIRNALLEFGAAKPGTVFYDPTTDDLFSLFTTAKRSKFFVLEIDGEVAGGAGIYPTPGLEDDMCELVKFYLAPPARGKGYGKKLMQACEETAVQLGYHTIYLESMPELTIALPLYEKMGYQYIQQAMGCSGHTGCTVWMTKKLIP